MSRTASILGWSLGLLPPVALGLLWLWPQTTLRPLLTTLLSTALEQPVTLETLSLSAQGLEAHGLSVGRFLHLPKMTLSWDLGAGLSGVPVTEVLDLTGLTLESTWDGSQPPRPAGQPVTTPPPEVPARNNPALSPAWLAALPRQIHCRNCRLILATPQGTRSLNWEFHTHPAHPAPARQAWIRVEDMPGTLRLDLLLPDLEAPVPMALMALEGFLPLAPWRAQFPGLLPAGLGGEAHVLAQSEITLPSLFATAPQPETVTPAARGTLALALWDGQWPQPPLSGVALEITLDVSASLEDWQISPRPPVTVTLPTRNLSTPAVDLPLWLGQNLTLRLLDGPDKLVCHGGKETPADCVGSCRWRLAGDGAAYLELEWHHTTPAAPWQGLLRLSGTTLPLPDAQGTLDTLRLEAQLDPATRHHHGTLDLTLSPPAHLAPPLNLTGRWQGDGMALSAQGTLAPPTSPDTQAHVTLRQHLSSGQGALDWNATLLTPQTPPQLLPRLLPPLGQTLERLSGHLHGSGTLTWGHAITGLATLTAQELRLGAPGISLEGLDAAVTLTLPDLLVPAPAHLSLARLESPLPVTDTRLQVSRHDAQHVDLEQLEFALWGGRMSLDPTRWQVLPPAGSLLLRLQGLDLAQLSHWMNQPGLSLEGRLSGQIPLSVDAATGLEGMVLDQGQISADGPGRIRLDPTLGRSLMESSGLPPVVLAALEDFHYDVLSATIQRSAQGEVTTRVRLEGHNPALERGRRVAFNLTLSGELDRIARRVLELSSLAQKLAERAGTPSRAAPTPHQGTPASPPGPHPQPRESPP
ncbi:MAG: YdbH domain-containing protein [Magnetococcus sp. WYHC-3]